MPKLFATLGKIGASGWLGPAANLVGGFLGQQGAEEQNRTNIKLARENRDWQERMANTAYQRAATDLEKAGLNRILSLGSPASTPSGNVAQVVNENQSLAENIAKSPHSAMALRVQKQQLRQMESAIENTDADTFLKGETALKTQADRTLAETSQKLVEEQIRKTREDSRNSAAQALIAETNAELYDAMGPALVALEKALPFLSGAIRPFIDKLAKGRGKP